MQDDLLKILSDSNKEIDNQKLMDYLSGKLSGEQKHEVEKWMQALPAKEKEAAGGFFTTIRRTPDGALESEGDTAAQA
ncbi:MAG: hypothetical protein EOO00_06990, partial [Chitinophagaceae bacterium]